MKRNIAIAFALIVAASACGDATEPVAEASSGVGAVDGKGDGAGQDVLAGEESVFSAYLAEKERCVEATGGDVVDDAALYADAEGCIADLNEALFAEADILRGSISLEVYGSLGGINARMSDIADELCALGTPTSMRTFLHTSAEADLASCKLAVASSAGLITVEYGDPEMVGTILAESAGLEVRKQLFGECFDQLDEELARIDELPVEEIQEAEQLAYIEHVDCMREMNLAKAEAMAERLDGTEFGTGDAEADAKTIRDLLNAHAELATNRCAASIDSAGFINWNQIFFATNDCEQTQQVLVAQKFTGLAYDNYLDNSQ